MRTSAKIWIAGVGACVAALILGALFWHKSFGLAALSDVVQSLLLLSGTMSFVLQAVRARGRLRLFWTLMATGIGFWFLYQFVWIYFELWLRTSVPDQCAADIVLFLHIVPLIAALALRPHAPLDEYAARLRRLDFALMVVWWAYLYVLVVFPWQFVVPNDAPYDRNLNTLYLIEKVALLGTMLLAWAGSKNGWKVFYGSFFGACLTYAASSHLANWAIARHVYYSGSFYDIPLVVSMAWITIIGLRTNEREPQAGVRSTSTSHGVWLARLGMIAAFSLPLFAAWALMDTSIPARIRTFRVVVTLDAALLMGVMVFIRQRLLDRELLRLLNHSRESLSNLKRLQAQITESEKLASVGQLVGGAAHELNNPITAMLGYSDLLQYTALTPQQAELAAKIGQHARRTRSLVASLLSFAKQGPAAMGSVDLNTLLRTAVKLSQPQWRALDIEVQTEFPAELLLVQGDSNQLLQVCVQIINDALHAIGKHSGRTLNIAAERRDSLAVIDISGAACASTKSSAADDAEEDAALSGLGLNACRGILQQHHGRIFWEQSSAGTTIRVEIPVIPLGEKSNEAGVPGMWQTQPSV